MKQPRPQCFWCDALLTDGTAYLHRPSGKIMCRACLEYEETMDRYEQPHHRRCACVMCFSEQTGAWQRAPE